MHIRSADARRDAAACAAIYAPYVRDTAISFETAPPDPGEMRRRIVRIQRTHPWLVAEGPAGVSGFAYAAPHRERAAYRWAADVSVYVEARDHRHGVGRALYEALFDLLRSQHVLIACAGITLPNPASVGIHEAMGFGLVGVYRRIGFKAGAWWDVGWWQLQLSEPPPGAPHEPDTPDRPSRATPPG